MVNNNVIFVTFVSYSGDRPVKAVVLQLYSANLSESP
jgi:hypothetical protein